LYFDENKPKATKQQNNKTTKQQNNKKHRERRVFHSLIINYYKIPNFLFSIFFKEKSILIY